MLCRLRHLWEPFPVPAIRLLKVIGPSGVQFGLLSHEWLTKSDDREVITNQANWSAHLSVTMTSLALKNFHRKQHDFECYFKNPPKGLYFWSNVICSEMICRIGLRMVLLVASLFIVHLLSATTAEQCGTEYSIFGMMLMRHNFKTMKTSSAMECLHACRDDVRCQSLNYVMGEDSCELNDRTNKARPEHFVPDLFRYYLTRDKNRGELLLYLKHTLETTVD